MLSCTNNEDDTTVFENLRLADGRVQNSSGGGVFLSGSSPRFENCVFKNNTAESVSGPLAQGGGMYCRMSSPTLVDCTFTGNTAGYSGGGGIYNQYGSNPTLAGTILCKNTFSGVATEENQIQSDKSSGYTETGVNCISAECIYVEDDVTPFCFGGCPADLNADGFVDGKDLGILLGAWSNDVPIADFKQDGTVDSLDLTVLMAEWGTCAK